MVEGQLQGETLVYFVDGGLAARIPYHAAKMHGVAEHQLINGQLHRRITYEHGVQEGLSQMWYQTGQLCSEGHFKTAFPTAIGRFG